MIQLPGTQPADPTLAPPPDLPTDSTSVPATGESDVMPDGTNTADLPEPVQVAGVAGALRGLLGKVFRKSPTPSSAPTPPPPTKPAAAAGGATPPPSAPKPPAAATPPEPKPAAPTPKTPEELDAEALKTVPGFKLPDAKQAEGIASEMTSGATRTIDPERTTVRNFRSDKLNTTDDIKALIDNVAEESGGFQKARRGTVSNAQTAEEAQDYGLEDLLRRKPAESWNAAQLSAGREILLELSTRITKAATIIDGGKATAEDMLSFRRLVANHAAVQETLQGAVAEAGRALQIMRTVSAAGGRLRTKQILETLDSLGGEAVTRKLAEAVLDAKGDPKKLGNLARKGAFARTGDALTEIWINGLLSNPATHGVNVLSNAVTALLQVPERAMAGVIGKVLRTQADDRIEIGEAGAMLHGLLTGWQDALSAAAKVARTGEPLDAATKMETAERKAVTASKLGFTEDSATGKAVDLFGEYYVRLPGRALMTEDEFFKGWGYRAELSAQAYRQATREGLEGDAFTQRVKQIMDDPPEDLRIQSEQVSRFITFQDSLSGDNWVEVLGQAAQKIQTLPFGKLVLPFVKTPTNIAEYVLERTPLAFTMKNVRADIAAGGARRDLAIARISMGSTIAGITATYAASGVITGHGPSDPRVVAEMKANGWQPNSVKIGDKWYSYNRLDPIGMLIGATADAVDVLRYSDDDDAKAAVAGAVVFGISKSLMSKTYLTGLSDVLEMLKGGQSEDTDRQRIVNYGAKTAASFAAPGWLNFIRQSTDDVVREPSRADPLTQTIDAIRNRTPSLAWVDIEGSQGIPPKLDTWGQSIRMEAGPLSPVKSTQAKDDQIIDEMVRVGYGPSVPSPKVNIKIDGAERAVPVDLYEVDSTGWVLHDYRKKVGEIARQKVADLVASDDYKIASDGPQGTRAALIGQAFSEARAEALVWLSENRSAVLKAAEINFRMTAPAQRRRLPTDNMLETTP